MPLMKNNRACREQRKLIRVDAKSTSVTILSCLTKYKLSRDQRVT